MKLRHHNITRLQSLALLFGVLFTSVTLLIGTHVAEAAVTGHTINISATSTDPNAPAKATFTIKAGANNSGTSGNSGTATLNGAKSGNNTTYTGTMSATLQGPDRACQNGGCVFDYQVCSAELNTCSALFAVTSIPSPVTLTSSSSSSGGGSNTSADNQTKCEDAGGLAWAACPIVSMIDTITSFLDSEVQNLLIVNPSNFNNPQLKSAWATIRNIALLVLVPIMLVMVIGTAMEVGPFDAYTVKRAMPRMLAAVLFIVLSYSICTYAVEFTNALGTGILGLLTSAVGQNGPITLDTITGGTASTIGQWTGIIIGVGAVTVAGLAGALTFGIAFSFGGVVILALFIGFVILIIRQVVVLGLILFAPLAILSWIFPGNDKIWGIWKTSFTRLLLMFPMITALIGVGRVFALLVNIKS